MRVIFRAARRDDLEAIITLFADDMLGQSRETPEDLTAYRRGFAAIAEEPHNRVFVGEATGKGIVATYQLTFISGLTLRAARRAQIESVRVASHLRGQGIGAMILRDAEARARAAGCTLMQLAMDRARADAHRFYEGEGFAPSHVGFKKALD